MKTALEYYKELSPEDAKLAASYCKDLYTEVETLADAIQLFPWIETMQGEEYWYQLYKNCIAKETNPNFDLQSQSTEERINATIKEGCDTNLISDGYHTFGDLYAHRVALFIALCKEIHNNPANQTYNNVWRTKIHSDGTTWDGWFVLGLNKERGEQITYHLPIKEWETCSFAETLEKAPEFDNHNSKDVLDRLAKLIK